MAKQPTRIFATRQTALMQMRTANQCNSPNTTPSARDQPLYGQRYQASRSLGVSSLFTNRLEADRVQAFNIERSTWEHPGPLLVILYRSYQASLAVFRA